MQAAGGTEAVIALHEIAPADRPRVGTKAATLGRLARAGLAVPEGLVLTTDVRDGPELDAALTRVSGHFGDVTLAVRSSAVAEDLPGASFAGQYDTVLDVRGADALRTAVLRCRASAGSERVRSYRGGRRASPVAVLVQRQVDADVAGVAFTADPVSGARDQVLVSAVPGLAEALVSGEREPDEWRVGGEVATAVRVSHQALAEAQARAVAALALRVEGMLGTGPQDVEWAMAGGRLVVLQARPITALPQPPQPDLPPGTWVKETDRHPEPLTALGASVAAPLIAAGLTDMFTSYGGLLERLDTHPVGGEPYVRVTAVGGHGGPPPPWWVLAVAARVAPPLRRRMRTARRMLRPGVLDGIADRWWREWRPQFRRLAAQLRATDLTALDDGALREHVERLHAAARDAMHVHFQLIPPYLVPVRDLMRSCARLLGWTELEAMDLLAGTSEATSEPTRALRELAGRIRHNPAALAAVHADGAAGVTDALTEADPDLGAALDEWCARYACRSTNDDPASPTLAESPQLIAALLRSQLCSAAQTPPAGAATAREAAQQRARAALRERPVRVRRRFEGELAAAVRAYPLREDVAFWTGSVFGGLLRRAALEAGGRLVTRGLLDRAEDCVHLDIDTLLDALAGPPPGDLRARVARARAQRAWVAAHPGPPHYGPPPAPWPDVRGLPRAGRRLNEALLWMQRGGTPPVRDERLPREDAPLLTGLAGSPGRYTGAVRIVLAASDFTRLRPGEVLVCPTTDPAWSVLFGIAGALIADGGAVLSHAAIVAREYGLPAVVGTATATRELRDGQVVTVDGGAGRVFAGTA